MLYILLFSFLIGLFITGMTLLKIGLFNLSSNKLKVWLSKLTSSPWQGLIVGTIITALIQSSSAVMVITIGLIAARILSFPQSIGIILGTNIGSTFTTEFITFDLDEWLIPLALLGTLFIWLRNVKIRSMGLVLIGISAVFTAMRGFENLAVPLKTIPFIENHLLSINENYLLSVVTGFVLTAIIQSSGATIGIMMGFLTTGIVNLEGSIGVMLGSNIGTCVSAYIASLGSSKEAKLSSYAHIWLNVLGVLLFYPFIEQLSTLVKALTIEADVQLAHASLIFNIITSLIVLPFANQFGNLILKIHKGYDLRS